MKTPRSTSRSPHGRVACTVSAAALMLGVSQAATVGINFQCAYSGGAANTYSGSPITATAFGVPPSGWESLTAMPNG